MKYMQRFIIHEKDAIRRENARAAIYDLDPNEKWVVEITKFKKRRSLEQNAYIHAVPFKIIADNTGNSIEDIKEFLCGEYMGWIEYEVMGKMKSRPTKTTSQMTSTEMTGFIDWLQWWASSNLNLIIPAPNEWVE